ncbi:hypothetical protein BS17DRAFT_749886 [Gyrodon lividus]|nr:hypothetical protein BS17DRAFT_749886 [Gyrodon lividus]
MFTPVDRKSSYKALPTIVTDRLISQEARRAKALEEQKRRRAQKFDSTRQLDAFADLNLGPSDDDADNDIDEEPQVIRGGVADYASLAGSSDVSAPAVAPNADDGSQPKTRRAKNKRKRTKAKSSKWADKCMYAELLEMKEEMGLWDEHSNDADDGLPSDLESGWVAVAPVPTGKRCLAITHQSAAGVIGISPNTTLRSRLLGKMLLPRFPSSLPPLTILDCILDSSWKTNGILHVLDVIKWKGQDVADCETPFRLWWRDTRLAELPKFAPPSAGFSFTPTSAEVQQSTSHPNSYNFPYPTSFVPIPYHTDTTFPTLLSTVIPMARSTREILVDIPISTPFQFQPSSPTAMTIDTGESHAASRSTTAVPAHVTSDGLLLYVSRASYEEGTSPLSCWIPITLVTGNSDQAEAATPESTNPLDLFQRLVHRRLSKVQCSHEIHYDDMEV